MGGDYRDLLVWQKAIEVAERIYNVTKRFPTNERFGLTSQMRRAAVSIPSNIAEGQGRFSPGEFRQFLSIATGSTRELETQVILASKLHYIDPEETEPLLDMICRLGKFVNRLSSANLGKHGDFIRQKR
jgi:four helix bundle protein